MKCPKCGSEHLKKNGFLDSGKQRYMCKDCGKGFSSFEPIINVIEPCIYCGSKNVVKSGKTKQNKQIYLCKDCHRKFNENRIELLDATCPICGGELRYKGWSNNGQTRRFICKQCKKGFNENTVITEKPKKPEKCPKCGATHINLCGHDTKTKKQRYKCVTCGYKFVENPTKPTPQIWEKECPICHHIGARKAGKSNGKQYYQCLECKHKFLEGGLFKHVTKEEIEELKKYYINGYSVLDMSRIFGKTKRTIKAHLAKYIDENDKEQRNIKLNEYIVDLILNGGNIKTICQKYNKTKTELNKMMAKYYRKERITNEQFSNILRFGVGAGVPVEYLAPYIKCSEKKCLSILSQYEIPERPKYQRTETEKHQDWFELNKFALH